MTISALPKYLPDWYTPSDQDADDNPARFKLMPLTGPQRLEIMLDTRQHEDGSLSLSSRALLQALKYGLVDWENIEDENGRPLMFSVSAVKRLPMSVLADVAGEIVNRSIVSEEERKN